ncbi:MAG: glycosyltransferase family 4 protein [Caldilineales bacterium]|nr:glycosyltransferase family 4 protein [Caldilineales bacterium]
MPRLLIITTNFPRQEGDPQSPWLIELLGRLQARGFEIDVLAPAYGGGPDQQFHGMRVRRFRYAPAPWETLTHDEGAPNKIRKNPALLLLLPFYLLSGLIAAWRLGRKGRYDLIHVHWPIPQGLFGLAARAAGGGRLVATFYGADLVMAARYPLARPFLRRFTAGCADVAAISTYTARSLSALTGRAARLIPYGVTVPPPAARWPAQPGLLLAVGRLVERKGYPFLIEALARLRHRPNLRLILVGEGHERAAIEARIRTSGLEDRVTLAGRVSDDDLQRLYQSCQMFILPAIIDSAGDTEMLGMVLLEAMRYRKPVIASAVGGIPDIVTDGETGLLVAPQDPEALAAAIARLLDDPDLAQRLGDAGYEHARARFSWEAIEAETLALYGMEGAAVFLPGAARGVQ